MDQMFNTLLTSVLGGGPGAIVAFSLLVIGGLVWDRRRMCQDAVKKDARFDTLSDKFLAKQDAFVGVLQEIKLVIAEFKAKMGKD